MQKLWKLVFLFWRPLFVWNSLFSLVAFWGVFIYGAGFLGAGLLIKLFGYTSSVYFQYHFSNKNNYYYLNAGYAIWKMYLYTFLSDFGLCLLLLILYFTIYLR